MSEIVEHSEKNHTLRELEFSSDVEAVVLVDTFSTGALIASMLHKRNVKVICVLSGDLKGLLDLIPAGLELKFEETFVYNVNLSSAVALAEILLQINALPFKISAVIAGAETGVELADRLSEAMGLRTNGTENSQARRNKFDMGEQIRSNGIRAVKQIQSTSWDHTHLWLAEWNPTPFKIVVKPVESAGSDGVTLCNSMEEVKAAFEKLYMHKDALGVVNTTVLIQEYLEGDEYVIDTISRDGVHKVAAIWVYDRRKVNGAGFVCFGQRLLTADEPHCQELIAYQKRVITALGIQNGPTHGEVKWCRGEPVLIEVGARCHGAEGAWMDVCQNVYGYHQVYATMAAYLDAKAFDAFPNEPIARHGYGRLLFLIVYENGLCEGTHPSLTQELLSLSSCIHVEIALSRGMQAKKTVDCFTFGGFVKMYNESLEQLIADCERIREMENEGLFEISPHVDL